MEAVHRTSDRPLRMETFKGSGDGAAKSLDIVTKRLRKLGDACHWSAWLRTWELAIKETKLLTEERDGA